MFIAIQCLWLYNVYSYTMVTAPILIYSICLKEHFTKLQNRYLIDKHTVIRDVMFLSFRADVSEQTVQTQIRLLLIANPSAFSTHVRIIEATSFDLPGSVTSKKYTPGLPHLKLELSRRSASASTASESVDAATTAAQIRACAVVPGAPMYPCNMLYI